MPNSTKQQFEGAVHEAEGAAKQKVGQLTENPELEAEGEKEKIAGFVQKKLGELEKLIGK